jgi:crotonobetainyl-CoA:carnitine CoA-transferase CaiB-like acyl-CoA transferase
MFEGIRILEVSAWVMVPGSGVLMSDLGADVIKVEHPTTGDPARGLSTGGTSPSVGSVNMMVEQTNRGKRSIGLDIATPEGRDILMELVATSDIFLTSLLPEVRKKLRIDVDDVRAHNPSIIYAKADAVGPHGPEQGRPGFDSAVFFGRAGILNSFRTSGHTDLPTPRPGFGDKTAAMSLAFGMASALYKRERTGTPSVVDTSLLASAMWVASSDIIYSWVVDRDFSSVERPATNPISNKYRTSDGRWIMLAMLSSDRYWPEFCRCIGRPDLIDDERYATSQARAANHLACGADNQRVFDTAPLEQWRERLAPLSGPWEVVQTSYEVVTDAQAVANGYIEAIEHPSGQAVMAVRSPVRFDDEHRPLGVAPDAWEHTDEILLELGRDWDQIIDLKLKGIVP